MIIGISAKAGCGKTTLANLLLGRLGPSWSRLAFADVLKAECSERFGYPLEWNYSEEGKARKLTMDMDVPGRSGPRRTELTVRELLQWYGTDVCRARDPDHWVKALAARVDAEPGDCLVDDVRFPNEAAMCRMLGACIRLEPYDGWEPGPGANHASETALDGWPHFDLVVRPRFGELECWAAEIAGWIEGRMALDHVRKTIWGSEAA